jgi:hypothetical protein
MSKVYNPHWLYKQVYLTFKEKGQEKYKPFWDSIEAFLGFYPHFRGLHPKKKGFVSARK